MRVQSGGLVPEFPQRQRSLIGLEVIGEVRPLPPPQLGYLRGNYYGRVIAERKIPAGVSPDGHGTPSPKVARPRPRLPAPGRPYLAARPREAVAATEREAQGRGAAWPWPGTARWRPPRRRRRFVSRAAGPAQPRESAARSKGGGSRGTVAIPRAHPFKPSQPARARVGPDLPGTPPDSPRPRGPAPRNHS